MLLIRMEIYTLHMIDLVSSAKQLDKQNSHPHYLNLDKPSLLSDYRVMASFALVSEWASLYMKMTIFHEAVSVS